MPQFSPQQQKFIAVYSKLTGLHPGVVSAQVAAEEPVGASSGYHGTQDWLNIGITDSGPMGANNPAWRDPVQAAKLSAAWSTGRTSIPGFGHAAPSITNAVNSTAGRSPQAQISALQRSGWASSGYPNLGALFGMYGHNNPSAGSIASGVVPTTTVNAPQQTQTQTTPTFDAKAFEAARQKFLAGSFVAGNQQRFGATVKGALSTGANPLFASGVLTTKAPNPSDYMTAQTSLQKMAGNTPLSTHPAMSSGQGEFATPVPQRIADMQNFAKSLIGAPYTWGGGHAALATSAALIKKYGVDCSGFVSALLGHAGVINTPYTTDTLVNAPGIQQGRGQHVTVWDRAFAGGNSHVIIQIGQDWFESGGRIGHGVVQMSDQQAQQELGGGGFRPLHPQGF
jgi:cell wall-associated NlpC family hydrolase